MSKAVIVSACRTPIGKFLGSLKGLQATDLGALVVQESVTRAGIRPEDVEDVIMGNVLSAGLGQNPARQAAMKAGLAVTVPAVTVNKVCGSGLKAVSLAAQAIRAGDHQVVVAGGMESMSNAPYLLKGGREGLRLGHGELIDSMISDGLWEVYENLHMGCCGEAAAETFRIPRQAPHEYALGSHRKAFAPIEAAMLEAVRKTLEKAGWKTADVDLFELNEAFSVQAVALLRELELRPERVNVNGGAVALGHPIGCSGARVLTTLLYALADRKARRGVAALCLGGGNAVAMAVRTL